MQSRGFGILDVGYRSEVYLNPVDNFFLLSVFSAFKKESDHSPTMLVAMVSNKINTKV